MAPSSDSVVRRKTLGRRGALNGVALLFMHIGVFSLAALAAALFFRLGLNFPPCSFYELTGHSCLSCGMTRAVGALLHFKFIRSFLLNPGVLLTAAFALFTLGMEICRVVFKKRVKLDYWWIIALGILAVMVLWFLLRWFGIVPEPSAI